MGKRLSAVVIALAAAQLFSGCFFLRESNWTKDKVKAGKATTFEAKLIGGDADPSHFFILPRLEGDDVSIRKPVFDAKEKLGPQKSLVEDAVLGQVAVDSGQGCDASIVPDSPRQGPTAPSRAYKTANEISSANNKFVTATFKAKVAEGTAPGTGEVGVVYVGYWDDDGDGIPEDNDDDAINCTGFTTSAFLVK
jgi:hypothetical protein